MIDDVPDLTLTELNELRTLRLAHKTAEIQRNLKPVRTVPTKPAKTHRPNPPVWVNGIFLPSGLNKARFLGVHRQRNKDLARENVRTPKVYKARMK